MLATLVVVAATLLGLAAIMASFDIAGLGAAIGLAAIGGIVNALLWPLIVRIALPLTVLTFGIAALVLNGAVTLLAAAVAPGVELEGIGAAIVVYVALTVVVTAVSALLALDDDARVLRPALKRAKESERHPDAVPGVLFLEIDGLAHSVLRRALRDGNAPAMASWLREGGHRLHEWETDWSSQTGACQAGILHGRNEDMPAFRWWEKERGAGIVTNHPRDAAELERRVSDGRGLLHADGASRANILSGDAPHSLLTMSTVMDRSRPGRIGQDYFTYFSHPFNASRTLVRAVGDIARELRAAAVQRRLDVRPRVHRGFTYAVMRAWATVVQLDLQVASVIGDIQAGRPVSIRRSWPTTRWHTTRASSGPTRSPRCARSTARSLASPPSPRPVRGRTSWSSCPTTARPRARRSCSATGRRWRRSSPVRARPSRTRSPPPAPARTRRAAGWARR